jgi:hypothetical protein
MFGVNFVPLNVVHSALRVNTGQEKSTANGFELAGHKASYLTPLAQAMLIFEAVD